MPIVIRWATLSICRRGISADVGGPGVTHSEFNPATDQPLHFLQIWIQPNEQNTEPGYQQKRFPRQQAIQPVITPDGRDGTLSIRQDAQLLTMRLTAERAEQEAEPGAPMYVYHHRPACRRAVMTR